jgi:hypothetical protein
VAALLGTSSNVKLTIGFVPGSRNGTVRMCLASRLLTRAFNADQAGCMNALSQKSDAVADVQPTLNLCPLPYASAVRHYA